MILVIHTAGASSSLWLYDKDQEVAQMEWESGRELSQQLLATILELLKANNVGLPDLTGIVIFSGPGSFTSLRIGHATANALAESLQIPVVGAQGDNWRTLGLNRLATAKTFHPALPFYGAEAHITKPKS